MEGKKSGLGSVEETEEKEETAEDRLGFRSSVEALGAQRPGGSQNSLII